MIGLGSTFQGSPWLFSCVVRSLRTLRTNAVATEYSLRRELVTACEAKSANGSVLFRAFVEALGGLDPC